MEKLKFDRAVELAKEIVAEVGEDFVYPEDQKRPVGDSLSATCMYVHEGQPSCLVGRIMHKHGMSIENLSTYEGNSAWSMTRDFDVTDKARHFLDTIQNYQDSGSTWHKSVDRGINASSGLSE